MPMGGALLLQARSITTLYTELHSRGHVWSTGDDHQLT